MEKELKCKKCSQPRKIGRRLCHSCNLLRVKDDYKLRGRKRRVSKKANCLGCKNLFTQWRKKQIICPTCYKKSLVNKVSNNYVFTNKIGRTEHRDLAEKITGRRLTYNEVVHHVDENPKNNNLENLWVISRHLHGKLHLFLRLQRVIWEESQSENPVNCWDSLRIAQTKAWLEMTGANVIKLSELANQQPSPLNGEGSETKDGTSRTDDDIVQTTTQKGLGD